MGKRWRAPARHLSGPGGSEPHARPLTSPEADSHGDSKTFSSVSEHQVLHIREAFVPLIKKDTPATS